MSEPGARPDTPKPRSDKFHDATGDHRTVPPAEFKHSSTWASDLRVHMEGHGRDRWVAELLAPRHEQPEADQEADA